MNCLLVIIGVILLGIGIFLATRKDWKEVLGGVLIVPSSAILFISFMVLCLKSDTYKSFESDYKEMTYLVENYNVETDKNLFMLYNILDTVDDLNKQIEKNKNKCDNIFYGCFYNKKIGEFEPISIENLLKFNKEEE